MKDNAQRLAEMKRYLEWMEAKKAQSERLHDEFQAAGQTHDHHLKLWRAELSRKFRYMAVTAVIYISGVVLGAFLGIPDSAFLGQTGIAGCCLSPTGVKPLMSAHKH